MRCIEDESQLQSQGRELERLKEELSKRGVSI